MVHKIVVVHEIIIIVRTINNVNRPFHLKQTLGARFTFSIITSVNKYAFAVDTHIHSYNAFTESNKKD